MFGLSLEAKVIIAIGWTALVAVFTGAKVEQYVSTKYENILLQQKVVVVTREHKVAVLDEKTLQAAIQRQKTLDQGKIDDLELMNDILRAHANDAPILTPDELRQWNDQNKRLMGDAITEQPTGGAKLPNSGSSQNGQIGGPVGQQSRNP